MTWQGGGMNDAPSRSSPAGGVLIAIGTIGGAFIGAALGEATRGFLIGAGAGIALAIAIWLRNRR